MHVSIVLERLADGEQARALCGHVVGSNDAHGAPVSPAWRPDELVHISALGGAVTCCRACAAALARKLDRAVNRAAPAAGTSEVIR